MLESDEEEEEEHAELERDSGGEDGVWDGGGSAGAVAPPLLAVGCWLPIVACCVSCVDVMDGRRMRRMMMGWKEIVGPLPAKVERVDGREREATRKLLSVGLCLCGVGVVLVLVGSW